MRKTASILLLLVGLAAQAQEWHTYFAYNNVTQIAMSDKEVYALSDGSLFSVNKYTEQLHLYDNLHATGISCIYYDNRTEQLLIAYKNGKIDLLSPKGVQYVGDLYDKDMVQEKTIYNITVENYTAYLSTGYGIQTFDMRTSTFVDSYWIGPDGGAMQIADVLINSDSIYAFTKDSMFSASMRSNLSDYTYWKREQRNNRITPDPNKGQKYTDETDTWQVGGTEGIIRITPTQTLTYKPLGPLNNIPYHLTTAGTKLFVVSGGRWASQYLREGVVMIYEDGVWTNITNAAIKAKVGGKVLDFMNVAVDPQDKNHFFVTSYGTGLYEFRETELVNRYLASEDNTLSSSSRSHPETYTRLDNATYDSEGNLWMLAGNTGRPNQIAILTKDHTWEGISLMRNSQLLEMHTPGGLIMDSRNPNYKWIGAARANAELFLLDDGGTPFDDTDDRLIGRNEWQPQSGQRFMINQLRAMIQDRNGRIWLGTDKGIVIVDTVDYFSSDRCILPELTDNNGENPLVSQPVMALCLDTGDRIWAGTESLGVYVLDYNATEILAHYTSDNSPMLSNTILSLACDEQGVVYIGTAEGLVSWKENNTTQLKEEKGNNAKDINFGTMQQWRLHYSYSSPTEIAATPDYIYAVADGAIFGVDRKTEEIIYRTKADGLTSSSVSHIAYDESSKRLIITYSNGRMDLLTDNGKIIAMSDLYMKASSFSTAIQSISIGKHAVYLSMPFGVIAINPSKAEVTDMYYIGTNASAVDVKQVVESGDSIYAFAEDCYYSASLHDNLVDFHFWHKNSLPFSNLTHACMYHDKIYVLANKKLYILEANGWKQVVSNTLSWIRVSGGKLLAYNSNKLMYLADNGSLAGLTSNYAANDAVYTNGEYWLTDPNSGIIHVSDSGDDIFAANGPNSNYSYRLYTAHGQIYSVIGGRWASQYSRPAKINIYDGNTWRKITSTEIKAKTGANALDPVSVAVDPNDAGHFYVATYGTGVYEFNNYTEKITHYDYTNSTIQTEHEGSRHPELYVRTEGTTIDAEGNLWVMNATSIGDPLHVRTTDGKWHAIPLKYNGQAVPFITPSGIHIDRHNSNYKWMIDQRATPGVVLLDDRGTPVNTSDDRCIKRTSWRDQNGREITPEYILCLTQDLDDRIWIGTQSGIITIPSSIDFFSSNACRRIIIPRNDGTGLGDYLLGEERINCMAVDGGNRMWIGTENSGLYLIEDDTITVAHFTENNSLLPSNNIQSIVIQPYTGEVFIGTSLGLASYRSDASEAQEDMSHAYAFPNPVRPNYGGVISIAGLMDNTVVNIVDAGGNLVCKTKSHGGMAVWDGKLPDGRYATPGVYSALCNESGGKHTVVKFLVVH